MTDNELPLFSIRSISDQGNRQKCIVDGPKFSQSNYTHLKIYRLKPGMVKDQLHKSVDAGLKYKIRTFRLLLQPSSA